ncbi:hypothetical protein [Deinococcus marmoris]|uniref:Copper amine oxidase-like N-terminal domain-containing protein n=1 Tax=Deinococcus marmoris TaxID=249408 RepID=A0A1U7NSV3_9DEIO|nr:hypothetical protein [Deinococcus marmoris]OLV15990.1 hypothetical protein BOO71_0013336 [Deinococcus marmoris]
MTMKSASVQHRSSVLGALIVLGLGTSASAQSVQSSLPIVVNGKAHATKAVVIGGQTYVPLSVLKELGIASAVSGGTLSVGITGGATQTRALEGCLKQELFNGNWRVTVQSAAFAPARTGFNTGWTVDVKYANASAQPNKLFVNSLEGGDPIILVLKDGSQLTRNGSSSGGTEQFAPASSRTLSYFFSRPNLQEDNPPVKMLVLFREKPKVGQYTVADPNMRFDLTCKK